MTEKPEHPGPVEARISEGAFLLVDKPRGPSSHQVTAWVRDLLGVDRAGHAGTLDPNVSGLLWVGVGPALKLIPLVLEFPKRYVGVAAFHGPVRPAELDRVIEEFTGPVYQTPPVRSAVKRERRVRTIHRLKRLETDGDRVLLDVTADSGTYVRTLAVDLGEALGVGGHLEELRRTGTGPFKETSATSLTGLADALVQSRAGDPAPLLELLHPMGEVWKEFPIVTLKESAAAAVAHGADLAAGGIRSVSRSFSEGSRVALAGPAGELVALGRALVRSDDLARRKTGWVIDADRVLVEASSYPPRWGKPVARPTPPAA